MKNNNTKIIRKELTFYHASSLNIVLVFPIRKSYNSRLSIIISYDHLGDIAEEVFAIGCIFLQSSICPPLQYSKFINAGDYSNAQGEINLSFLS